MMQNVITLIADTNTTPLDERAINKLFITLEKASIKVDDLVWLAENKACDILVNGSAIEEVIAAVAKVLEEQPIDFIVQGRESRRKKLLICDMDSTIINQECIDEIADVLGLKEKVSEITERAMNGELDFADALRERVALLASIEEEKLQEVYNNQISLMEGAKTLVQTMSKHGAKCVLVSGGFTFFTEKVAKEVGFGETYANILEISDGKLTGKVVEPILDKHSKLETLQQQAKDLGIRTEEVLSVGDGANDLPMLKAAGLGVAYHAKPAVRKEVNARINHTNLVSVLYAQGYKTEDITDG